MTLSAGKIRTGSMVALCLAAACGGQLPEGDGSNQADIVYGRRVHKMPMNASGVNNGSAPAGAHLTYYGGRVVSNMQVVQVLYGTGSYLPQVQSTASPSIATFYQGILNSPYTDMFSEYNTPASGGTNQVIGRGSFLRQVTITPSAANNGSTIDDSNIQAELAAQISAGHLPTPTTDSAGNNNTYYAVFFPHGKVITQGGSGSCSAFCAYHGTIASAAGHEIYYGVHPDMQAGSGCETGCGGNAVAFNNYTSVASHEMSETITDCEVGLATTNGPPLAWYDNTNGENGDICNAQQGTMIGSDGVTYTVQKEFSNAANDCIVSRGTTTTNDFSIAASPSSLSITAGSSGSSAISTAVTSGSAQTVSLSSTGAPSGVTVSFSPASVSAGSGSTMTVSTTTSAAAGTYTLTVKGTATSGSHTTAVSLTIGSGGGGGGGGAITNGGFESGLSGWTAAGTTSAATSGCHGGAGCAQVGSTSATNGDSSVSQTFTAATGATGISLWYKETCPDTVTYDWALVTLKDNTAGTTATLVAKACVTNAWTNATGALTAGHSYTLTLLSHDDNYASDPTFTLYDDVTVTSGGGGGGGSGITNGNFESGATGWTRAGTTSVATSGCHGGAGCAMAGSTSATNGDSSFSQTFSVPTGKSQLSTWYAIHCPDTVTYDWATITLKDNTSGTTVTVLPKTCTNSGSWTNVTSSVTAGHSYTLTLTSHDDNYASDPTYTLFDDAVLN